jgi:apolipoprotein N-acyltransferase
MARWLALSQRSASGLRAGRPDLIVWPETMFPGPALNPSATAAMEKAGLTYGVKSPDGREIPIAAASFAQALAQLQATTGVPMLIGAIAMDGLTIKQAADRVELQSTAKFNSAVLVEGGAVSERRYDKIELTPFGEYMPFVWRFPAVQQALVNFAAPGMGFDLTRGTNPAPLELAIMGPPPSPRQPQGRVRLAVPICYEISFPAASRRLVYQGSARTADVMVNISNDGWFGDSDFSRGIHTLMGRWRCIELGVAMVRAVNTGQSCAIDALGNVNSGQVAAHWADASSAQAPAPGPAPGPVTATATLRREGLLETELPIPVAAGTLFGKIGDWLGPLCGIVTTGSLVWGLFGAGRGRPAQSA